MPVTKSAIRALRKDRRRAALNRPWRLRVKSSVKKVRKEQTPEALKQAQSTLDRAAKRGVVHKRKAARLKSRLAHLLTKKK